MADIDQALKHRFSAHADDPDHREAVIVTLAAGGDARALERAGMRVEHAMSARPIVSGSIDARTLEALAAMDDVVRVELDSSMRALGG